MNADRVQLADLVNTLRDMANEWRRRRAREGVHADHTCLQADDLDNLLDRVLGELEKRNSMSEQVSRDIERQIECAVGPPPPAYPPEPRHPRGTLTDRDELVAAIRAFTREAPDDKPNGDTEHNMQLLRDALERGYPFDGLEDARQAYRDMMASFAFDTKRLRQAAERYLGGDLRA